MSEIIVNVYNENINIGVEEIIETVTLTINENISGDINAINTISRNSVQLPISPLKNVDIEVPENTSDLTNDSLVESVTSTDNHIQVDNTDPKNPKLSFTVVDNENFVNDDEKADIATIPDKANTSDVNTALGNKADLVNGLVPASQLPSYVDDVIEVANFAALPETGESGKIYITQDDNLTYRWSGTGYAEISKSLALGETSSTAYRGDRGKTAYDHSQITGNPHGTTAADVGASPLGHNHSGEGINPDYIVLDEEYTDITMVALPVGSLFYNVDQLAWLLKTSSNTYLNLGEENTYIAKNGDNVTHLEGQATYVTSGGGNLDVMTLASSANGKIDALLTQDVLHTGNGRGMYCFGGKVRTFPYSNVIKSTDNENTWIEGAELYLCSEAGRYSTTKEAAPAKCSVVGKITQRNGANISVSFRPFKAISVSDLSDVDGNDTTIADTDVILKKDASIWKKVTWANVKTLLNNTYAQIANYFSKTESDRRFVNQNGGTIYHITRWFTPTSALTIAANGLSATITSGQFTSVMTGAKLRLTGGVNEPIITYVSSNSITLSFAVDSAFFGQSVAVADWGVYSKSEEYVGAGNIYYYNTQGVLNYAMLSGNLYTENQIIGGTIKDTGDKVAINNIAGIQISNDRAILFSSTTTRGGTKDLGIRRISDGLMEIYNGITNGVLRDLKLRSLYADKIMLNSLNTAPSSATDTGTTGEVRITSDYIYVCTATNTWKRTPLTTW